MKLRQLEKSKNSQNLNTTNSTRTEVLPLMVKRKPLNYALLHSLKKPMMILGAAASSMLAGHAFAGPEGGVVTNGGATITQSGNHTQINQTTNNTVIDWDSFNVDVNESVRFVQPSSSSVILNNIHDQNASQIFGKIDANGTVFLTNNQGIVFGETSQVNVANLVATSMNINANDFMNDDFTLEHSELSATQGGMIVNYGLLNAASGGSINLVADGVDNQGVIIAHFGSVNLASGEKVVVDFDGNNLIKFEVSGEIINNAIATIDENGEVVKGTSINNSGIITANAGQVLLQGNVAQNIFDRSVNNDGVITAGRMESIGGVIHLTGIGIVENSGSVNVNGLTESDIGGQVQILGGTVLITESATIDASGADGGGEILIGGDFQGSNSNVKNATNTYVSADSVIKADALAAGNGGKIIVWADQTTIYQGDISAQGGSESGDGGFVEVSGKQNLAFYGDVSTDAVNGTKGELLLDPEELNIVNFDDVDVKIGDELFDVNGQIAFDIIGGSSDIAHAKINKLLETTSVSISAKNTININSGGAIILELYNNDNGAIKGSNLTLTANEININNTSIIMENETADISDGSVTLNISNTGVGNGNKSRGSELNQEGQSC
ncbi:MAG: filamentous hemagglutinin N-terminal domain-containing protein [Pseudomonadales bacterium]|nr:filamentous hemagglutinin N-terminal domain-containing protein [Pseudomonadales bacterium]